MALLDSDKDLSEKLELSEVHEMSLTSKIDYLDEQIEGIKHQLWRSRVDAILNHNIATENDDEKLAVAAKVREHEQNVKRYAEAITLLTALGDELTA